MFQRKKSSVVVVLENEEVRDEKETEFYAPEEVVVRIIHTKLHATEM